MAPALFHQQVIFCFGLLLTTTHGDIRDLNHRRTSTDVNRIFDPLVGVGVNIPNLFWERLQFFSKPDKPNEALVNGKNPKHSFSLLKSKGIDLVRFAASPYCQSDFAMWRQGGDQESVYWHVLDEIIYEAKLANVRLIPTLIWRARMPSFSCREEFSFLFQYEKPSCARTLIRLYVTEVVSRYQKYDNIIAWELFNELNYEVDIKLNRSACTWNIEKQTNGIFIVLSYFCVLCIHI